VGPRAGLDTEARGKILCPRRGSNPDRPVVQPVDTILPELTRLIKNSVRTSKRTPHFTITKINWLMLFKEIIDDCAENDTKLINTKFQPTCC
jgi:hypothetical protein